jgi:alcohol dehydrogenase
MAKWWECSTRGSIAKRLGASRVFQDVNDCPNHCYEYGIECSAYNIAFKTLQKSLLKEGSNCILSDGNKEILELQPEFYEKELKIVGSSDGWDYQEHAKWYFAKML